MFFNTQQRRNSLQFSEQSDSNFKIALSIDKTLLWDWKYKEAIRAKWNRQKSEMEREKFTITFVISTSICTQRNYFLIEEKIVICYFFYSNNLFEFYHRFSYLNMNSRFLVVDLFHIQISCFLEIQIKFVGKYAISRQYTILGV